VAVLVRVSVVGAVVVNMLVRVDVSVVIDVAVTAGVPVAQMYLKSSVPYSASFCLSVTVAVASLAMMVISLA
jgi:hypothetical protein